MSGFRDLCWQLRYEGNLPELVKVFFSPLTSVAIKQSAQIWSLSRESLLPLSLHHSECQKHNQPLRLLISPIGKDTENPQTCDEAFAKVNQDLKWATEIKTDVSGVTFQNEKLVDIRVQSLLNWDSAKVSPTRCLGIASDDFGNSVQYVADWGETKFSSGSKFTLHVSWSWGDPSCTVKNNLRRFDHIWNSENGLLSYEADVILSNKLPVILNYLLSCPYVESAQPKKKELFPHQKEAVDNWMKKDCRGIFQMCTGAGKTIASLAAVRVLADKLIANGEQIPPVIVTVPTRILADQWVEEIRGFGFPVILQAYNAFNQWNDLLEPFLTVGYDGHPRFVVTTYCSFSDPRFTKCLTRAADDGHTAVWIADEMHNLSTKTLRQTMSEDSAFFKYRLGLSATPDIENDFSASDFLIRYFGDVCQVYDLRDGITDKVLCRYRYYPVPAFLSPELGAPYLSLLAQIHDKKVDSARLINLYRESRQLLRRSGVQLSRFADLLSQLQVAGKQMEHTLVYCPPGYGSYGSEKSDEIDKDEDELRLVEGVVGILRGKGHSTASILGETVSAQRREILTRFRSGELQTLCAIGCLDEGVDVPSIKRAIVLYSVDRNKQFVQRRGRILRNPKRDDQKIAEIYDIILLPQGTDMPPEQAEVLIEREFRRYRTFADLAMNREEAQSILTEALNRITSVNSNMEVINGD